MQRAFKLAAHMFVRPGGLRRAEWSAMDMEKQVWGKSPRFRFPTPSPTRQARACATLYLCA